MTDHHSHGFDGCCVLRRDRSLRLVRSVVREAAEKMYPGFDCGWYRQGWHCKLCGRRWVQEQEVPKHDDR